MTKTMSIRVKTYYVTAPCLLFAKKETARTEWQMLLCYLENGHIVLFAINHFGVDAIHSNFQHGPHHMVGFAHDRHRILLTHGSF